MREGGSGEGRQGAYLEKGVEDTVAEGDVDVRVSDSGIEEHELHRAHQGLHGNVFEAEV